MKSPSGIFFIKDLLLPMLAAVGLFFIYEHPAPDWGDDFAQYLQQAENIAQGKSMQESAYQFNPNFARIGPKVYPAGFPLLLSTLANADGKINVKDAQSLILCFCILLACVVHLVLRQAGLNTYWALGLSALFVYHPFFIALKPKVLSDIPFTLFLLGSLYAFKEAKKSWHFLLAAVVAGFAISIRSIGWVLPLSAIALFCLHFFKGKKPFNFLAFAVVSTFVGFGINYVMGYYQTTSTGYLVLFNEGGVWLKTINQNFSVYLQTLQFYFTPFGNENWHLVLLIFMHAFLGLLLLGLLTRLKQIDFYGIFAGAYILVLLLYPFTGGFRFLLPTIPLVFILIYKGSLSTKSIFLYQKPIAVVVFCLYAISYYPELRLLESTENSLNDGPNTQAAKELFSYLNKIPNEEVVLFLKPRALAYYTEQTSYATEPNETDEKFKESFVSFKPNYFITCSTLPYPALNKYLEADTTLQVVFKNDVFKVWTH